MKIANVTTITHQPTLPNPKDIEKVVLEKGKKKKPAMVIDKKPLG